MNREPGASASRRPKPAARGRGLTFIRDGVHWASAVMNPVRPWAWPLLLIAVMFFLATVYPATKRLSAELSPLTISLLRYGLATLALLPWYARQARRSSARVTAADVSALAALGLLGVALFSFCLTTGVAMSTSSSGSLLTNSQPIFTTLLAPLIIDEKFTPRRLAGALLGLAGVGLIVTGGRLSAELLRQEYFLGNLVLTGGAVAISIYTILLKRFIVRFGGLIPTFLTMLAGSLFLAAAVLATGGWRELAALKPVGWLLAVYIGLAGTALVYPLFNAALRGYGVVRSVGYKLLIPVFGILLSYLLLAERPTWPTLAGAAVVIGAVLLIQRAAGREAQDSVSQ
jgi:drug/metabolite transporter (DMT)-like permease